MKKLSLNNIKVKSFSTSTKATDNAKTVKGGLNKTHINICGKYLPLSCLMTCPSLTSHLVKVQIKQTYYHKHLTRQELSTLQSK